MGQGSLSGQVDEAGVLPAPAISIGPCRKEARAFVPAMGRWPAGTPSLGSAGLLRVAAQRPFEGAGQPADLLLVRPARHAAVPRVGGDAAARGLARLLGVR